jgi:hypothetical protein
LPFHVKAPIFVARQLVKHKFLRWNEISRRYVDDEPEFYVPEVWRGKSADKKQGSEGEVKGPWGMLVGQEARDTLLLYTGLLKQGVAPEQARMVLPQSTLTEWFGQVALTPSPECATYVVHLIHSTRAVLLLTRSVVLCVIYSLYRGMLYFRQEKNDD